MNFANKQFLIGIKVQSQVGVDYSPNLWQALVGFHSRRLRRLAAAIFFGFKVINYQKLF